SSLVVAVLLWQGGQWYATYVRDYPPQVAWTNQDGLAETVARAVALAPGYHSVWISGDDITYPHVYLLAAEPLPPAEIQQLIEVRREPGRLNGIMGVGRYRFGEPPNLPRNLPALEAVPDQFGGPGFVIQEWQDDGQRHIIVRRMKT
ncbi:MAG: hypothetical protein MUD01_18175, partial [Chloroflexaceae bacterium]|nr:hypothetical protein [Chloroflexaceae bacterium]